MAEPPTLCGIWIGPDGQAHRTFSSDGKNRVSESVDFEPFAWSNTLPHAGKFDEIRLDGDDPFRHLLTFDTLDAYREITRMRNAPFRLELVRGLESQHLLAREERLFTGLTFTGLRRCQCDIETYCAVEGGFSNAKHKGDRVLAIGCDFGDAEPIFLCLDEMTDDAEKALLEDFGRLIRKRDPDVIEGHNIFNFDLEYLRHRCKRFKIPCAWGRYGQNASFRKSRVRVAERWIDFVRCDIPGRTVFDTYFAVQFYDLTARDMESYSLKDAARHLGVTPADGAGRTYIDGSQIQDAFTADRDRFLAYLGDDLRETRGVANRLLPTYFAQTQNFPMTLQEIILRGSASKVDLLLSEKYFHARRSLPEHPGVETYEGGFTRSYETGVFRHVLHFDVASLYPSLLMTIGRGPANDSLGIFIPLLRKLREYRLKYKHLARDAESADLRTEYSARQASFKILINSFYGYLGFDGARFADSDLASEVTRRGRDLLQELIANFQALDCTVLEADTDGIYVSAEPYFETPEKLLAKVAADLPDGIDLEYDGSYSSMFCYGAKNYALYDGKNVTIRGSALRSRGIEPYLKELTTAMIHHLLGSGGSDPVALAETFRGKIRKGEAPVEWIAKSEHLGKSPAAYRKQIEGTNKPRRAALEVALTLDPPPGAGDRVAYYVMPKAPGRSAAWQRARAAEQYDRVASPYDPAYYMSKIDDWLERYDAFLDTPKRPVQGELF